MPSKKEEKVVDTSEFIDLDVTDDVSSESLSDEDIESEDNEFTELSLMTEKELKVSMSEHKRKTIANVEAHSLEDYDYVRSSIYDTLEKGQELLDVAISIATETESPAPLKAATELMKMLIDSNQKLIDLQKEAMVVAREFEDLTYDDSDSFSSSKAQTVGSVTADLAGESTNDDVTVHMTTTQLLEMLDVDKPDDPIDITPTD